MDYGQKHPLPAGRAEEVCRFVAEQIGERLEKVTLTSRLEEDLGVTGDDAEKLLIAFAQRFQVDLEGPLRASTKK